ncbi:MAG: hypothetical protein IKE42_15365 [Aquamicrobium sp.]|nr:hypothetical protein [Aquamicrobium sp.]
MDHSWPLADHDGPEALDATTAHDLVESTEQALLTICQALRCNLVGLVDNQVERGLVLGVQVLQERRQESVLLAVSHLRGVNDRLHLASGERQRQRLARIGIGRDRHVGVLPAKDRDGEAAIGGAVCT